MFLTKKKKATKNARKYEEISKHCQDSIISPLIRLKGAPLCISVIFTQMNNVYDFLSLAWKRQTFQSGVSA